MLLHLYLKVTVFRAVKKGVASLGNICLLLILTMYIYAVVGIIFLRGNDPWHFRSIEIAFLSLLRLAFFDVICFYYYIATFIDLYLNQKN